MSRRKIEDRNIRKITKRGEYGAGITVPIEFLRKLKWKTKQKVVVELKGKSLIIKDWKK